MQGSQRVQALPRPVRRARDKPQSGGVCTRKRIPAPRSCARLCTSCSARCQCGSYFWCTCRSENTIHLSACLSARASGSSAPAKRQGASCAATAGLAVTAAAHRTGEKCTTCGIGHAGKRCACREVRRKRASMRGSILACGASTAPRIVLATAGPVDGCNFAAVGARVEERVTSRHARESAMLCCSRIQTPREARENCRVHHAALNPWQLCAVHMTAQLRVVYAAALRVRASLSSAREHIYALRHVAQMSVAPSQGPRGAPVLQRLRFACQGHSTGAFL